MARLLKCHSDASHKHFHTQQATTKLCGAASVDMALAILTKKETSPTFHAKVLAPKFEDEKASKDSDRVGVSTEDMVGVLNDLEVPNFAVAWDKDAKKYSNGKQNFGEVLRNPPKGWSPFPVIASGLIVNKAGKTLSMHWVVIDGRVPISRGTDMFCVLDPLALYDTPESGISPFPIAKKDTAVLVTGTAVTKKEPWFLQLVGSFVYVSKG